MNTIVNLRRGFTFDIQKEHTARDVSILPDSPWADRFRLFRAS
jgi:hypothetical protein